MSKRTEVTQASPGNLVYYSLDKLLRVKTDVGLDEWGVCECANLFWLGRKGAINGKNTFRLSLLEVLDNRDKVYPDWGNEEVYLFCGFDGQTKDFTWFLLNQREFNAKERLFESEGNS